MLHIGSARFCEGPSTSYVRLDARVKEIAVFCPETEFATDSSLEEDGFELPIPGAGGSVAAMLGG